MQKQGSRTEQPFQGDFENPDFAFPRTVSKNAESALDKALLQGEPVKALSAAMQLDISSILIDRDSADSASARFEMLSNRLEKPYGALALLLKARLEALRYGTPQCDSVVSLTRIALADSTEMLRLPIQRIAPLVTEADEASAYKLSVLDFVAFQAVETLNLVKGSALSSIIPFNGGIAASDPASELLQHILSDAVVRHRDDKDPLICSVFSKLLAEVLDSKGKAEWLRKCWNRYKTTRVGAPFASEYAMIEYPGDGNDDKRERLKIFEEYILLYPDGYASDIVKEEIAALKEKAISVGFPSKCLPGEKVTLKLSGNNVLKGNILLFKLPGNVDSEWVKGADIKDLKPSHVLPFEINEEEPCSFSDFHVETTPLAPGLYTAVYSSNGSLVGALETLGNRSVRTFRVSAINSFVSADSRDKKRIYITDARNNKPLAGIKVNLWTLKSNKKTPYASLTTNRQGYVEIPNGEFAYEAKWQSNIASGHCYKDWSSETRVKAEMHASLLTDRSICHPGDSLAFAAIAYTVFDKTIKPFGDKGIELVLRNHEWEPMDTISGVTDSFGRSPGIFKIPEDAKPGTWSITALENLSSNRSLGMVSFDVAEYKTPTFSVTLQQDKSGDGNGKEVLFRGTAMTYTGMPVADARVDYVVRKRRVWWRGEEAYGSYSGTVSTDSKGCFSIVLDTSSLKGTPYAVGLYSLEAYVGGPAGETQSAPSCSFSLGKGYTIGPEVPEMVEVKENGAVDWNVRVLDLSGAQVKAKLRYEIADGQSVVGKGEFEAPGLHLDLKYLPSGKYDIKFSMEGRDVECNSSIILWRQTDKRPPVASSLWIPEKKYEAKPGEPVKVRVGSYWSGSNIFVQISSDSKWIRNEWVEINNAFSEVTVDCPDADERLYLTFLSCRDFNMESVRVEVIPENQSVPLVVEKSSFRDYVTPGADEKWNFRFSYESKGCPEIPVLAVMTDKALSSIVPFKWHFNPGEMINWYPSGHIDWISNQFGYNRQWKHETVKGNHARFSRPEWETYGYSLYPSGRRNMYKTEYLRSSKSSMKMAAPEEPAYAAGYTAAAVCDAGCDEVSATNGNIEEYALDSEGVLGKPGNQEPSGLRMSEHPVAFFMPALLTGSGGYVDIAFKAPEFIGTWSLQVLGYNREMKTALFNSDILSAKPVMAKLNPPRFLRTGDRAVISGTLFNNSGTDKSVWGEIEVINPSTGAVLGTVRSDGGQINHGASRQISIEFKVPSDVTSLIVKLKAFCQGASDGEMVSFPVLPSSTPVVESKPFWLSPGQEELVMEVGDFPDDAEVRVEYCDSPVWECIRALPLMMETDSENVLSLADAYFANRVASGLVKRYPEIADSVRASLRESVKDGSSDSIADVQLTKLLRLQNSDGGWSWCPGMKSSVFATQRVVERLASLKNLGFSHNRESSAAKKACGFIERELTEEWRKSDKRSFPVRELLGYLPARLALGYKGNASGFSKLENAFMADVRKNWKKLSVWEKASVALYVAKSDNALADVILRSLSEYASVTRERGMWYANEGSAWNAMTPLVTTVRVLEAFNAVDSKALEIDKLRQGIVTAKQTLSWENGQDAAVLVAALLETGNSWISGSSKAEVSLEGNVLRVKRSGNGPAWGAVIGSWIEPVKDVKAASVSQLKVTKSIIMDSAQGDESCERGDLVKVVIDIKTDRDMNYVTVKDSRSACLEPDDQLSHYECSSGLCFYKEVGNSATTFYIPFLPKGTHRLEYNCHADRSGTYSLGIADGFCGVAPMVRAHSAGGELTVVTSPSQFSTTLGKTD